MPTHREAWTEAGILMANNRDAWTDAVTKGTVGRPVVPQKRRSKYGAVKVTVDNIVFDSKREAARYHELKLLEKAGQIQGLEIQPRYILKVRAEMAPVTMIVGEYVADFRYWQDGDVVVEDAKGFKNPLYLWKKKHTEIQYGIQIRET